MNPIRIDRTHLAARKPLAAPCGDCWQDPSGHAERLCAHEARVATELARLGRRPAPAAQRQKYGKKGRNNVALGRERRRRLLCLLARAGGRMACRELRLAAGLDCDCFRRLTGPRWFRRLGWGHGGVQRGRVKLTPEGWKEARRADE